MKPQPTESDVFAHLVEQLKGCEEAAYILGHYYKSNDEWHRGQGFLAVGEMFHMTIINVTNIATKSMRVKAGFR